MTSAPPPQRWSALALGVVAATVMACGRDQRAALPDPALFEAPAAHDLAAAATSRGLHADGAAAASPRHDPGADAGPAPLAGGPPAPPSRLAGGAVAAEPAARPLWDPNCPGQGEAPERCPRKLPAPAARAVVAHILVAWRGSLPDGVGDRDEVEAEGLARGLLHRARAPGADLFALMAEASDDDGPGVFVVDQASRGRIVGELAERGRQIGPGEVDLVRSRFGWHVLTRLPDGPLPPLAPPRDRCDGPCPLRGERAEACSRGGPALTPDRVEVGTLLVGWRGATGRARRARSRAEARTLAVALCHALRRQGASWQQVRDGADAVAVERSLRPGPEAAGRVERMALALPAGGVAVVETGQGAVVVLRRR